jgi:hypothetical protein
MAETYKKIDDNTLEITSTYIHQVERKHFEEEKQMAERDIIEAQKRIDEINMKLNVLGKIVTS